MGTSGLDIFAFDFRMFQNSKKGITKLEVVKFARKNKTLTIIY